MSGVARTIVQLLLLSSGLQIWLLGIGLVLSILGLGGEWSGWHAGGLAAVAAILGLVTTVAAPIVLDAVMFRSISAPRVVALIPHGRLKLLLGALCSQLLLSVLIGLILGTLLSFGSGAFPAAPAAAPLSLMGRVSVIAFAGLTWFFLGFYWASQFMLGGLWFVACAVCPRLIMRAVPPAVLQHLLTTPSGLTALLAGSLAAWLLFALPYLRARRVRGIYWANRGRATGAQPTAQGAATARQGCQPFSTRRAVHRLLLGSLWKLNMFSVAVYAAGTLLIGLFLLSKNMRMAREVWLPWAALLSLFAALVPGISAGWMTLRARCLWLHAGLARSELYRLVELQSWRLLGMLLATALCIEVPLFILIARLDPATERLGDLLTMPLVTGATFIYVNLLGMPERRLAYVLIAIASGAVLLIELCLLAVSPLTALPMLLATQVVAVPVLRAIAQRRWQRMDWLINNPTRTQFRVI